MSTNKKDALELVHDDDTRVAVVSSDTVGILVRSEVEAQLDAAHKHPRSIHRFLDDAITLATYDQEIAASCIYAVPRAGKVVSGPSVRLAEICASSYGNLHMGKRVIGAEDKEIVAQGAVWDLEKNNRIAVEVRRRISDKNGRRYGDDMITQTGNAAASIAFRNAVFTVIPKAYVSLIYQKAREVSVGNASTLVDRRTKILDRLTKIGALPDRILLRLGRASFEDITLDDLEVLIGLGTAIKNGDTSIDDAFPAKKGPAPTTLDQVVDAVAKPNTVVACYLSDFDQLKKLAEVSNVSPKAWHRHIEGTMGFAAWETLTKDRLAEVQAWIKSQAK